MRYYLIAGEASGDQHAANLIRALKQRDAESEFRGMGGDNMQQAGASLVVHYREMALMGGIEVLMKYGVIRKNREKCRQDMLHWKPDVLILVDYSGFNLPMARFASRHAIRVIYYISPKLWAWAKWRVKTVRRHVMKMIVNLPFEKDFYASHGVDAEYYGNPVYDSITDFERGYAPDPQFRSKNGLDERPIVALLAGSRKQEVLHLLPEMLAAATNFSGFQFVIAGVSSLSPETYESVLSGREAGILYGQTYELLKHSVAAVVTSGTATLETALLGVPQVVVYKTSKITFFIGRMIVRVTYFSLVNLILNRPAVKELLQQNLAGDIRNELSQLLHNEEYRKRMAGDYSELRVRMGEPGTSDRVAGRILSLLAENA